VKKVQSQLRSEQRALDREMRQIDQGSTKTKAEIKKLAKKGDVKNAKILAREVVRASKQKNRLAVSKARLNSIHMQLQHQLGKQRNPPSPIHTPKYADTTTSIQPCTR
jgi:charged multivesicular body protein 3